MFGIEIIDASLLPALIVALFAGLISFLSPCVLPIVPPYLAYMSGVALNDVENKKGRQKIIFTPKKIAERFFWASTVGVRS